MRDFNKHDLVEISDFSNSLRVIGRSHNAQAFKTESGKWCSLIDKEDEITRACAPDLLAKALVFRNSKNLLVLVSVASDVSNP